MFADPPLSNSFSYHDHSAIKNLLIVNISNPASGYTVMGGIFGGFFLFMYIIQHYFICRPSDSTLSEDAGNEPRTGRDFGIENDSLTL
jgi:hypothetical protein